MRQPHSRYHTLPWAWPARPLHVVLVEPEIPQNTGNIARLCAATGTVLHLVEPLGFQLTDAALRRAGLDYWDAVDMRRHPDLTEAMQTLDPQRCFYFSTAGERAYTAVKYAPGDVLIFGSESAGLPDALLDAHHDRVLGIPMRVDRVRSLNLATTVGIALYEALRQLGT